MAKQCPSSGRPRKNSIARTILNVLNLSFVVAVVLCCWGYLLLGEEYRSADG